MLCTFLETYIHTYKPSQWMKLQSDIGHFPTICGTCPVRTKIDMFCQTV